jgi:hypothetical protein
MKELQLSEVKVIYETLKSVAAKNTMTFSRQWRFRDNIKPYEEPYEEMRKDSQDIRNSKEKDLAKIGKKLKELFEVKVNIEPGPPLTMAWFEEVDTDGNQIKLNGDEMDVLLKYEIIEVEKPEDKPEEEEKT